MFRIVLAATLIFPVALFAQLTTTTVSGTVTDPSGAVVADAIVSAIETSTGNSVRAQSNAAGFYVLTGLLPGKYRVRIEKPGFQTAVQEAVTVEVNRPVTLNVGLQVGAAAQTVQVEASSEQVDLRSQTLSYDVNTQMVTELPLNGRNVLQLMQLAPDASPIGTSGGSSSYQQSAARPEMANTYVSASGGRGNSTGFYLDGAVNEDALTEIANIFPNPDAIQEFSFETNNYSAKFGGRGGGVMNVVTRGGTNQFHGALFEFLRNSDLNARNYFSSGQDGLNRNQFGGTVGGPIRRDKTFFFFSYQGTTLRQTALSNSATTLTAAQRAGDFSADKANIVDPATQVPFPGKQVPVSRFDPIAEKILNWVPVGAPGSGLVYYPSRTVQNDKQFVVRGDHNVNDKLRIYGSYLYDGLTQPATTIGTNLLTATPDQYWRSQNAVVNATYTFRSNLLATFVASVSRRLNTYTGPTGFQDWPDLGAAVPKMVTGGSKTSLDLGIGNYFSTSWDGIYTI
ncbi:MAG TPA: carboxypeptidase-like regulatory domain-containing protein, partial [Bryobacteraceae bacterium]